MANRLGRAYELGFDHAMEKVEEIERILQSHEPDNAKLLDIQDVVNGLLGRYEG